MSGFIEYILCTDSREMPVSFSHLQRTLAEGGSGTDLCDALLFLFGDYLFMNEILM